MLHRHRLTDLLDSSASRLIVVRAPGGSGKTLAVADWLRERRTEETTIWLAADERAAEHSGFWFQLLMAIDHAGFGSEQLSDLMRGLIPMSVAPEIVLQTFNAEGGPDRLVIDDAHLVESRAAKEVARLVRRLGRTQLVVTTRRRGILESASTVARFEPLIITEAELSFDGVELEQLIATAVRQGRPHPLFSIKSLHDATKGHALSTRVALAHLHSHALVDVKQVAQLTAEDLLPVLGAERDIALRVALVPAVDEPSSIALTGDDGAPELLHAFEQEGLGEFDDEGLFRFHAVIRDAFAALADDEVTPSEKKALRRLAAERLGSRPGWGVPALHLAAQAGAPDLIWRLYLENFSEVMNHFREPTMAQLQAVPTELLVHHGGGACALAAIHGEDERRPSIETLNLADGALAALRGRPEPGDAAEAYLQHLAIYAAHRTARRYDDAADVGEALLERILAMDPTDRIRVSVPIAIGLLQLAISSILTARLDRAQEILSLMQEQHPARMLHQTTLNAYVHAVRGRMVECRSVLAELPPSRLSQWNASVLSNGWHIARAVEAVERGDGNRAIALLADVRQRAHTIEHWPFVIWAEGVAWLTSDDLLTGSEQIRHLLAENRDRAASPAARALMLAAAADLELATGNESAARMLLDQEPGEFPATLLSRARLALRTGDVATAKALTQRCLSLSRVWPRHRAEAYVIAAVAVTRSGRRDVARRLLHRGIVLAEENGLTLPLLMASRYELEHIHGGPIGRLDGIRANPFSTADDLRLSGREREVLLGLLEGLSLAELAKRFFVTPHTIKSQSRSLYRKLGVGSRKEAAAASLRLGLLSAESATVQYADGTTTPSPV